MKQLIRKENNIKILQLVCLEEFKKFLLSTEIKSILYKELEILEIKSMIAEIKNISTDGLKIKQVWMKIKLVNRKIELEESVNKGRRDENKINMSCGSQLLGIAYYKFQKDKQKELRT